MKVTKTLALPIICLLGILALSTLLTGYFINMRALRTALTTREYDKSSAIHTIIHAMINGEANKLYELARVARLNGELREALLAYSASKDHLQSLRALMEQFCPQMDDEFFELADAEGNILYSSTRNRQLDYGLHLWGMDEALKGTDLLASTKDPAGWAMRAYAPIVSGGKTCGVFIVGMRIDDRLASRIAASTNTQIMLARLDEVVASSNARSEKAFIDDALVERSLFQEKDSIFVQDEATGRATMYTPFRIVDETFCLVIQSNIASLYGLLETKRNQLIDASVVTLSLVFILGSALTVYLIRPLNRLRDQTGDMIKAILPSPPEVENQGNEIRTLVQAFNLMTGSIHRYIKERDEGQTALQDQLSFLQTLIDSMPNPVFYKDDRGRYLGCNLAFEKYLGLPKDKIIGNSVHDIWPKDLADLYYRADSELLSKGGIQVYESSVLFADGTRHGVIFHKAVFHKSDGSLGGVVGTMLDITERKIAEQERIQLVMAMEQVAECIIITGKDDIIQYVNPATEGITGFGRADTIGHHVRVLETNHADPAFFRNVSVTLSRGEPWHGRFSNKRKDGAPYELETMVSPVRDDSGDIVNYVIVARDVTHESRLEQQLRQAQKMDSMGRLAGGIAHDFNNILAAIIGFTELALHSLPKESKAVERLTEVLKAGARAKDLVKQILTFTRQSEQERKPLEVAPVVKETLKFLRASLPTTIEIRQNIEADRAVIMADATQIHQVLMNLSTNAAHAMDDTGGILEISLSTVEVRASSAPRGHNRLSGPCMKLVVSDTGHGMERPVMEKVFEPYFTTKPMGKGTGMGLAVVHGIVAGHGGTIEVQSQPGKGTTFTIHFPRIDQPKPVIDLKPLQALPSGNERVLVIDDEMALTRMMRGMLEYLGYSVTTENSPMDAVKLFSRMKDELDLVITDQTMPLLTGDALARQLLELKPDLPIILITGYSEKITEEQAKAIGIRALLLKPIAVRDLAVAIRQVLGEKQPRRESGA